MAMKDNLKGSSLLEVLIGLSILSLCFVIGMMIFRQLTGIHSPPEKFKTAALVEDFLYSPPPLFFTTEEEKELSGRRFIRKLEMLSEKDQLFRMSVSAYLGERLLMERSRITRIPHFDTYANPLKP